MILCLKLNNHHPHFHRLCPMLLLQIELVTSPRWFPWSNKRKVIYERCHLFLIMNKSFIIHHLVQNLEILPLLCGTGFGSSIHFATRSYLTKHMKVHVTIHPFDGKIIALKKFPEKHLNTSESWYCGWVSLEYVGESDGIHKKCTLECIQWEVRRRRQ